MQEKARAFRVYETTGRGQKFSQKIYTYTEALELVQKHSNMVMTTQSDLMGIAEPSVLKPGDVVLYEGVLFIILNGDDAHYYKAYSLTFKASTKINKKATLKYVGTNAEDYI